MNATVNVAPASRKRVVITLSALGITAILAAVAGAAGQLARVLKAS